MKRATLLPAARFVAVAAAVLAFSTSVPGQAISAPPTAAPLGADAGMALPPPGTATQDNASPDRVVAASPDEKRLVAWAAGRFAAAGLPFPRIDIVFHAEPEGCSGLAGYAVMDDQGPIAVHMCTRRQPWSLVSRRVLLHELGHAWASENLGDAAQDVFLAERGLPTWGDPTTPWELRGTEQAAEILAWALLDEAVPVVAISDAAPDRLAAAYRLLTGSLPPPRLPWETWLAEAL